MKQNNNEETEREDIDYVIKCLNCGQETGRMRVRKQSKCPNCHKLYIKVGYSKKIFYQEDFLI